MIDRPSTRLLSMDGKEFLAVGILGLVFSFILTFRMWGEGSFDAAAGLSNWMVVFIGITLVIFFHEAGHKIAGAREAYRVRIVPFTPGLAISGFIALYSQGFLPIITPNLVECDAETHARVGYFRKYDNPAEMARIAIGGLVGSCLAIMVLKFFSTWTGFELLRTIMLGAILHAFYSLIPWELINLVKLRYFEKAESYTPGDGMHILWWSRTWYVIALVFIIMFGLISMITSVVSVYFVVAITLVIVWAMSKWLGT